MFLIWRKDKICNPCLASILAMLYNFALSKFYILSNFIFCSITNRKTWSAFFIIILIILLIFISAWGYINLRFSSLLLFGWLCVSIRLRPILLETSTAKPVSFPICVLKDKHIRVYTHTHCYVQLTTSAPFVFIYLLCLCVCMYHHECVKVTGQLLGGSSRLHYASTISAFFLFIFFQIYLLYECFACMYSYAPHPRSA